MSLVKTLTEIQRNGFDPTRYPAGKVLGVGSYSLVFDLGLPESVLKVTTCPVSIQLLRMLLQAPKPAYVGVQAVFDLGSIGPEFLPAQGFLLERLTVPSAEQQSAFHTIMANVAHRVCCELGKPRRGRAGYAHWQHRYCEQAARLDREREEAWLYLADHVQALNDDCVSIDVLTDGNMLLRDACLVFSDPIRQVVLPMNETPAG